MTMTLPPMAKAKLFRVGAASGEVAVQFNPTTLSYSVQNTLQKDKNAKAKQYVGQSSAKLDFDLIFDSTHNGVDVRGETAKIKQFLDSRDKNTNKEKAPPVVGFLWGSFSFNGVLESFRETLDFFSVDGVPLRSTVKIALAAQDRAEIFREQAAGTPNTHTAALETRLAPVPARGTTQTGTDGGNPGAGREVAASNRFDSMRLPGAALAAITGGVNLKPAAGFAPAAAPDPGLEAFAGLNARAGATGRGAALDLENFEVKLPLPPASADYGLGGKVLAPASSGLRSDVGSAARIKFD